MAPNCRACGAGGEQVPIGLGLFAFGLPSLHHRALKTLPLKKQ